MQRRDFLRFAVLSTALTVSAGCAATAPTAQSEGQSVDVTIVPTSDAAGAVDTLNIAAASSLNAVITAFCAEFTQQTKLPTPQVQSGSSSTLGQQIVSGAAFDIFCAADMLALIPLIEAKLITKMDVATLATTELVVVAQPNLQMQTVADIAKPGTHIVVGDENVPIGRYTTQLWKAITKRSGDADLVKSIKANIVSYEEKAIGVIQKFFNGEADVAVVYAADLAGRDPASYTVLTMPEGVSITSTYFGVRLPDSKAGSADFLNIMLDPARAHIWKDHGFAPSHT